MSEMKEQPDKLSEIVYLSYLYDFYGSLLKENHRHVFEDYVLNDMSLGEIAAQSEITRQGVYDIVKRCSKRLYEYEEKLELVKKFRTTKEKLKEMEHEARCVGGVHGEKMVSLAHEIYDII